MICSVIGYYHIDSIDKNDWHSTILTVYQYVKVANIFILSLSIEIHQNHCMTTLKIIFSEKFTHSWPQLLLFAYCYCHIHFNRIRFEIHIRSAVLENLFRLAFDSYTSIAEYATAKLSFDSKSFCRIYIVFIEMILWSMLKIAFYLFNDSFIRSFIYSVYKLIWL